MFVQKVKGFNTRELIYFLKTNPHFAQAIGFDPINNYVPSEATFSVLKKKFDLSLLDKIVSDSIQKGIQEGIFDPNHLCIDSYPIIFHSFFNNKKSQSKFKDYKEYYTHPIQANFGVKPVSNSKPVYDKFGNQKQAVSYFGFKAHTVSFFNLTIFTVVSPASHRDKNYAFLFLFILITLNLKGISLEISMFVIILPIVL